MREITFNRKGKKDACKEIVITVLFISIFFFPIIGYSQENNTIFDQQQVNEENFIDTLSQKKSDKVFTILQKQLERYRLTRHLSEIIIISPKKNNNETSITEQSNSVFEEYRGLYIRNIRLSKLNVFGPKVTDTLTVTSNWIERTGNKLHVKTLDRVIRKNLVFKEGDKLDPLKISDNERILRSLSFLEDARILVHKTENPDSVDIVIITKDQWPYGIDLTINNIENGRIDLKNNNLFGTGHTINNKIPYKQTDEGLESGYIGYYYLQNIGGSFINGAFSYSNYRQSEITDINLSRPFYSPFVKYAGGLNIMRVNTLYQGYLEDNTGIQYPVTYQYYDYWVGRSFAFRFHEHSSGKRTNLILAGRYTGYFYDDYPPLVSSNTLYSYHTREYLLYSLSLSRQLYYRSNLIYNFGRTEDIPVGSLFELTSGVELNRFFNRRYTGISYSIGQYIPYVGYNYFFAGVGSFINEEQKIDQGVFSSSYQYFSNLFVFGRFKVRQFLKLHYINGMNRFIDEKLHLDNQYGIVGLESELLKGTQKLSANIETVTFTPYYLIGFRFVAFAFADIGYIGSSRHNIFENQLYSGLGFGIRMKNERLVLNTIQVKLAYYPVLPEDANFRNIYFSSESNLNPPSFSGKAPGILNYE